MMKRYIKTFTHSLTAYLSLHSHIRIKTWMEKVKIRHYFTNILLLKKEMDTYQLIKVYTISLNKSRAGVAQR